MTNPEEKIKRNKPAEVIRDAFFEMGIEKKENNEITEEEEINRKEFEQEVKRDLAYQKDETE